MMDVHFRDDDDDDQEDDQDQDDSDETSDDDSQDTDDSDTDTTDTDDTSDGAQALSDAAPQEVDAHRNMIGDALQQLSDRGIDVDELAEKAGVSSADVNELDHGDLAGITQYLAQNHPELMQEVSSRFPQAQGLLSSVLGGSGGSGLSGLLGRFL